MIDLLARFPGAPLQPGQRSAPAASTLAMSASLNLMVHVKEKVIAVSCGDGSQPVRWLANVGLTRYDDAQGRSLGQPIGVKLEDGQRLGLGQKLIDAGLKDQQHVFIVLKGHRTGNEKGGPGLDDDDD